MLTKDLDCKKIMKFIKSTNSYRCEKPSRAPSLPSKKKTNFTKTHQKVTKMAVVRAELKSIPGKNV